MALRTILAGNLKRLRSAQGVSQETLADLAKIDRTYVSLLERERYAVSIDVLEDLARALGVHAYELIMIPPAVDDLKAPPARD